MVVWCWDFGMTQKASLKSILGSLNLEYIAPYPWHNLEKKNKIVGIEITECMGS